MFLVVMIAIEHARIVEDMMWVGEVDVELSKRRTAGTAHITDR